VTAPPAIGRVLPGAAGFGAFLAFSPDGKLLASSGPSKDNSEKESVLSFWDVARQQLVGKPWIGPSIPLAHLLFSPDGKLLVGGRGNDITFWEVPGGKLLGKLNVADEYGLYDLALSPDGKWLASGGGDSRIILWNVATRQMRGRPMTGHRSGVYSLAFSPDGKILASAGFGRAAERHGAGEWDSNGCIEGEIRFWDVATGQPLGQPVRGHTDTIMSVAFSPDGKTLASGAGHFDGTIRIWDVVTRRPVGLPFVGHAAGVRKICFSKDGKMLASAEDGKGNWTHSVILWDVASRQPIGKPLTGHIAYISALALSPDGKTLASGSPYGDIAMLSLRRSHTGIILWDLKLDSWLGRASARANRNLTIDEWRLYLDDRPYRKFIPELP
jgi:WD40 repeat protein